MGVVELARELIESPALQGRDALYEHEAYDRETTRVVRRLLEDLIAAEVGTQGAAGEVDI